MSAASHAPFASVEAYLAAQPQEARAALERVRAAIRSALPRAEETISYNIPAYRLEGTTVLHFAGWKHHYSLYPAGAAGHALKDALATYEVEKGTIRFPLAEPVPERLIAKIASLRAKEVGEKRKTVGS